MENLNWYTIPKYPKYEINVNLQVRHKVVLKIKSCYMDEGYLKLNLQGKKGFKHKPYLHQLSAQVFVPNPNNKPEIHHIDEDKLNNHPSNLMWVTKQEHREISRLNEQVAFKISRADVVFIRDNYSVENEKVFAARFDVRPITIYNIAIGAARTDIKEGRINPPKGLFKKIVNIETNEIVNSAKELSEALGIKVKEIHRQLNGERYCLIPYRYVGEESNVRFKPPKEVKTDLIGKFQDGEYLETLDLLTITDNTFKLKLGIYFAGNSQSVDGFHYKRIAKDGGFIEPKKFISKSIIKIRQAVTPSKKVIQFDLSGNIVKEHPSMGIAAKAISTDKKHLKRQVRGVTGFCKGYIWKYA